MPGTSLVFRRSGLDPATRSRNKAALQRMLHYPSYRASAVLEDRHLLLSRTAYEGYPYSVHEGGPGLTVVIEGKIYNRTDRELEDSLRALHLRIRESDEASGTVVSEAIGRFTADLDGEYLVLLYDSRRSSLVVFNDPLGRLPVYYHFDGDRLLLSREVKFLLPHLEGGRFDPSGVMQYLLFGAPLGATTLVEGVRSLPAGSCCRMGEQTGFRLESHAASFLETDDAAPARIELPERCSSLFLDALRARTTSLAGSRTVLSLSGGLDSRAVLAGLCRLGHPPLAITTPGPEEGTARQVADRFGIRLSVLARSEQSRPDDYFRFSFLKDGLDCHPGLPGLHLFMEELIGSCGDRPTYYTGIMGGEITRHYNATGGLQTVERVARHVLDTKAYYKYSTRKVAEILGASEADILALHIEMIRGFPESDPKRKYIAFRHEFYRRYTFEAEDRNRFYCWTVSPFLAIPFYRMMMSIDERWKGLRLWRDVLRLLDPRSCKDPYFNRGISLESDLALSGFGLAEALIRHAPIKRAAQELVFRSSTLRTKLTRSTPPPLRAELSALLARSGKTSRLFARAPEVMRKETDMLGIERLHILCSYAEAEGFLES